MLYLCNKQQITAEEEVSLGGISEIRSCLHYTAFLHKYSIVLGLEEGANCHERVGGG